MALLNTTCPRCGAPHAKLLSVIHRDGISTVETTTQSVGKTNTIAQVKITSSGTTSGISQSEASKAAAPPFVPPLVSEGQRTASQALVGGVAIGFVVALMAVFSGGGFVTALLCAAFFTIAGIVVSANTSQQATKQEKEEYQRKYAKELQARENWSKTFACSACAFRFIPEQSVDA